MLVCRSLITVLIKEEIKKITPPVEIPTLGYIPSGSEPEIHVKVSMHSEKCRKEVMKAVTKLSGVDELSVDLEKEILMVIGDVDPVCVATCLRKKRRAAVIISVGPKKEKDKDEDKEGDKNDEKIIPITHFNAPHGYGYSYFPVYPPSRHGEGCFML